MKCEVRKWISRGDCVISDRGELHNFIAQHPLVEKSPTFKRMNGFKPPGNVFLGIGLCTKNALTRGMPIDVLGMMLVAEKIGKEKHVLIADEHAKINGFGPLETERVAQEQKEILLRMCQNLKLEGWHIVLGSEVAKNPEHRRMVKTLAHPNEFVRMEIADIEWFRRNHGIGLKIGWALEGSNNSSETFLDDNFAQAVRAPMSFLYTVPGRTFDPWKPRAPPYFCGNPNVRVLLQKEENVAAKIAEAKRKDESETFIAIRNNIHAATAVNGCLNFLKAIARTFNLTLGENIGGKIEERIQTIVGRCVG